MVKAVLDTNVIVAAHRTTSRNSPNKEILKRWQNSVDTLTEYAEVLLRLHVPIRLVKQFIRAVKNSGTWIEIRFFHLKAYPEDPDDIAFLLCALNGRASHLITNDAHLLIFEDSYPLAICKPLEFLSALRDARSGWAV